MSVFDKYTPATPSELSSYDKQKKSTVFDKYKPTQDSDVKSPLDNPSIANFFNKVAEEYQGKSTGPAPVSGMGELFKAKMAGQETKAQPLKKLQANPSLLEKAALGATGPALVKGAANPATLQGNSPIKKGLNNFNAQGVSSAVKSLGNQASFLAKSATQLANPSPIAQSANEQAGNWIKSRVDEFGNEISKESNKRNDTDENSLTSVAGDVTGKIVGAIPSMSGAAALTNGAGITSQALKASPALTKLAAFFGRSGINTASSTIAADGRLPNAEELKTGAAVDAVFSGAQAAGEKVAPYLYRFATKLKSPFGYEKSEELANEALKLGLTGGKKTIVKKANDIIASDGTRLTELAKGSTKRFNPEDLVKKAFDDAVDVEKLGDPDKAEAIAQEISKFLQGKKGDMNAEELLKIKRYAAEKVLPALRKGELRGALDSNQSAKRDVWSAIYNSARDGLNQIDGAEPLTRKLNIAYSVKEPLDNILNKVPGTSDIGNLYGAAVSVLRSPAFTSRVAGTLSKIGKNPVSRAQTKQILNSIIQAFQEQEEK